MIRTGIGAILDRAQIVGALQDAFSEQEPRRELAIRAWRAHDDGERPVVQAYFEGLLSRRTIDVDRADAAPDAGHVYAAIRVGHAAIVAGRILGTTRVQGATGRALRSLNEN